MSFFTHAEFNGDEYILKRNPVSFSVDYIREEDVQPARHKKRRAEARLLYKKTMARREKYLQDRRDKIYVVQCRRKINNYRRAVRKRGSAVVLGEMTTEEIRRIYEFLDKGVG